MIYFLFIYCEYSGVCWLFSYVISFLNLNMYEWFMSHIFPMEEGILVWVLNIKYKCVVCTLDYVLYAK